jgi:formate/nitrite transporter FocA (FNT family)
VLCVRRFFSYLANFVGSLAMVAAVFATGTLVGNPVPVGLAETKCSLPFATAFVRAVLCNWLVCMAVWSASAASSLPGKLMGLWPPIAAFVAIGLVGVMCGALFCVA